MEWNSNPTWQEALNELTDKEVDDALFKRKKYQFLKYPVIKLNKEMSYRCVEVEIYGSEPRVNYLLQCKWWQDDEWVDVTDLTELKIWEHAELVNALHKHYPDYPIDHLEGRFV
tara:strand:+ start:111 stop:452 length:342 start_codon:yes stop_codon:yes gene_type:complete